MKYVLITIAALIAVFAVTYIKAPPGEVNVVTGLRKKPGFYIERGGMRIPFLERSDVLTIREFPVVITTPVIRTRDLAEVEIEAAFIARCCDSEPGLSFAARNFINFSEADVGEEIKPVFLSCVIDAAGETGFEDIYTSRKAFADKICLEAKKAGSRLGIEVISCSIQKFEDRQGLLKALEPKNND